MSVKGAPVWKQRTHLFYMRGIHRSPVNSPHKGQWRGALTFSLICTWMNGWVNNREAGNLRRYRAHYDFAVMSLFSQNDNIPWLIHKGRARMPFWIMNSIVNLYLTIVSILFYWILWYIKYFHMESWLELNIYLIMHTWNTKHASASVEPIIEMHCNIGFQNMLAVYNTVKSLI